MYKNWYIKTKNSDINMTLSCDKSNWSGYGVEHDGHGFKIHLGKCHFHYSKYTHELYS